MNAIRAVRNAVPEAMAVILALAAAGCCNHVKRETCPPDNQPVYVPTDCTKGYEVFASEWDAGLGLEIFGLLKIAPEGRLKQTVVMLAEKMNNLNVELRTVSINLCQSQMAAPCDPETRKKVLEFRGRIVERLGTMRREAAEVRQQLGAPQTAQAASPDAKASAATTPTLVNAATKKLQRIGAAADSLRVELQSGKK